MGKRKKMPRRPHCKVAPKEINSDKKKSRAPAFEVRIRISKRPGEEGYSGGIEAKDTDTLVEALAVMVQRAAGVIGAPEQFVYAKVATVLFKEPEDDSGRLPRQAVGLPRNDMEG